MTKRKPGITSRRKGVPSGAPADSQPNRRGAPEGAPAGTDRAKGPSLQKNGLPIDAYAIRPDEYDVFTWQLPHHTSTVFKDVEASVDWPLIEKATLLLSMAGDEGQRISADPELIIEAARHIASHYRRAGKTVPIALCVLI